MLKFGGSGTSLETIFSAGEIPNVTSEAGLLVTVGFKSSAPTGMVLAFDDNDDEHPSIGIRHGFSSPNGRTFLRITDSAGTELYSGGMNVTSGTYHTDEDVRVTALLYRSADESKYRMEMWCQDAVVASDQLAGLASGIEELLTRFRLGAGYSTSGQLPTCDCAIGFGISRDDAEYIHDFLYNEGAHRSTRELPATSYFVHLYRLDRIGAGESVLDTDDEIQDEIGSWHLVNAAASGEPTWDTNAPPYSLPDRKSVV